MLTSKTSLFHENRRLANFFSTLKILDKEFSPKGLKTASLQSSASQTLAKRRNNQKSSPGMEDFWELLKATGALLFILYRCTEFGVTVPSLLTSDGCIGCHFVFSEPTSHKLYEKNCDLRICLFCIQRKQRSNKNSSNKTKGVSNRERRRALNIQQRIVLKLLANLSLYSLQRKFKDNQLRVLSVDAKLLHWRNARR